MHALAFAGQPLFTMLIEVALISIDIPAGIGRVEYVFEMERGVFAGCTDLSRTSLQRLRALTDSLYR